MMTEAKWLKGTDPTPMLEFLCGNNSNRKLRLFGVACCRRIWHFLNDVGRKAVQTAELFADGKARKKELSDASGAAAIIAETRWAAERGIRKFQTPQELALWAATYAGENDNGWGNLHSFSEGGVLGVADAAALAVKNHAKRRKSQAFDQERICQCDLLREIFGNPFQPTFCHPKWLTWEGGTVVRLAKQIYQEYDFASLPVLADALEEAGCIDPNILGHCRRPGEHARGCWAVDLLLGKS
jgi:hypothetical protein